MIKGFKDFIMRGNVIDLAVAVVIGAAFTAVVNAIVASIITPMIELVWKADEDTGAVGPTVIGIHGDPVTFPIGGLISAIISFLAVALVVYLVFVYPMNRFKERAAAKAGVVENEEAKLPTEQELLVQIRDLLEKQSTTPPTAR
ncbi:large conductance mechanosensitive channel protein MscL [Microbacterium sp. LjRoot45]|uniref:large conductance mechanosensitive channel protein MscL n=1 Tax=Microbacterium sp. LjRoot45 TaxID=3342329 RepID=UPI003ED00FC0